MVRRFQCKNVSGAVPGLDNYSAPSSGGENGQPSPCGHKETALSAFEATLPASSSHWADYIKSHWSRMAIIDSRMGSKTREEVCSE